VTSITITLPIPHKATHPNSRVHFFAKSRHVKKQRQDAFFAATIEKRMATMEFERAATHCKFYFRTKHSRDIDNLTGWLKSTFDGFADAGVVANDKAFMRHTVEVCYDKASPRVEITISELTP
jgi:Holliday junction resolvase RusA-like endonuclease